MKPKKVIIIFGQPGAGKSIQAEFLSEKFGFYHIETSEILEKKFKEKQEKNFITIKGKKYYLNKQEILFKSGKLTDPIVVAYLIKEKIKELFNQGKSLVFSGSPRTIYEAETLIPYLKKLYGKENIKIILLEITPDETVWRNTHRRICELMGHLILFNKETKKLKKCPLDGSKLLKRPDLDKPATIRVRLKEYNKKTFPIIDYFEKQGLKVEKLNGSLPPAEVFKNILKVLD